MTVRRRVAALVGTTAGAALLVFGVGAPPERCPEISAGDVDDSARAAVGWLVDNQQPDGRWLYEYDRSTDTASDDYNIVRHAGVMSSLYQAASRGYDGALESADRGLAWALDHVVERSDWVGVTTSSTLQAGTNSLLVAALAERRAHTGDGTYDELMGGLARFLDSQVEPSGALLAYYDLEPDRPRPDTYSIYYTGEAYWALGRMHRTFPDAGWGGTADRIGAYLATERDEVEDIWPPLADHWSGYGLGETAAFPERPVGAPLTEAELEFTRRQGGLIGQRVRSISQRFGPWGPAVRGTFTPRGGGYGVFGEGLTGLWRASLLDDRLAAERDVLGERAVCITGLAIEAQADADEASEYAAPAKVEGAWFIDDITRMDDQQHALSALLLTVPIIDASIVGSDTGPHPAPMWILWLVVSIGVFNPVRFAIGARQVPIRSVVAGAAAGGAVLLAVASTSGWLIDAIGTSRPALRLATASLCLLSAGIDMVRPRPTSGDDVGGPTSWLVPIAVPLVVRPALLIAGLSIVADHSLPFHLVALAASVGTGIVLAAIRFGDRIPPAVVTWISRLLSASAVVAGVLLIADAVFDI